MVTIRPWLEVFVQCISFYFLKVRLLATPLVEIEHTLIGMIRPRGLLHTREAALPLDDIHIPKFLVSMALFVPAIILIIGEPLRPIDTVFLFPLPRTSDPR